MGALIAKNLALFNLRKRRDMDQADVAAKIGISLLSYQKIERGQRTGKIATWLKIQKLYDIPDEKMWKIIKQSI